MPSPPARNRGEDLAQFYFDRGNARAQLGRLADSIADANKAIEVGRGAVSPQHDGTADRSLPRCILGRRRSKESLRAVSAPASRGCKPEGRRGIPVRRQPRDRGHPDPNGRYRAGGGLSAPQPAAAFRKPGPAAIPPKRAAYNTYGQNWEAEIELGRAMIFEARGQFREAEASYQTGRSCASGRRSRACWVRSTRLPSQPPARCRRYRAQPGANEGAAGTVRGSRGRCAPRAAVAAEGSGQVQSADAALHHRTGRHPGRGGPLRGSRATRARLRSRSTAPSASPTIRSRRCSCCRSSATS